MKDLLLVIDMQNVYFPDQPWACPSIPRSLQAICRLLDSPACGEQYDVIFTRYLASSAPGGRWACYNQEYREINEAAELSEMAAQLQPYLEKWPLLTKSTYSSCTIPQLRERISTGSCGRVLLAGVVAECCVLSTMMGLIDEGAHVCYLKDAISGQSPEWEERIEAIAASFSPVHTEVLTVSEYLKTCNAL